MQASEPLWLRSELRDNVPGMQVARRRSEDEPESDIQQKRLQLRQWQQAATIE
jgi:hypothetical protein